MSMRSTIARTFLFFLLFLGMVSSCGRAGGPSYKIALDPSWYPWNFQEKSSNITGFSTELLSLIAEEENLSLSLLTTNWDDLLQGLKEGSYQGALSSLFPYNFNKSQYDFSSTYLPLGPVLLLPSSSSLSSLEELSGKEVGVLAGSSSLPIVRNFPKIYMRTYDKDSLMINDLLIGRIDGALLPLIQADSFVRGTFQQKIKIATPPLNAEGLRLLTITGKYAVLLQKFDKALKALKKKGTYQQLLQKWELSEDSSRS